MSRVEGADSGLRPQAARPVPPGVAYHRVLAGEQRQIGLRILAIVLLLSGLLVVTVVLAWAASLINLRPGAAGRSPEAPPTRRCSTAPRWPRSPLLIPWSMAIQRRLYGVPGASLHSIVSPLQAAGEEYGLRAPTGSTSVYLTATSKSFVASPRTH